MKLYNPIENDGLIDEVLRICGVTASVYSNKSIISRLNNALDRYWQLASDSAPAGTFDDTNNSSLPVETQDLVVGTNAYKMTSFTNNVLQISKVAILNDDGDEQDLIYEPFDDLQNFYDLYTTDSDQRGIPGFWTKMGDYIYIRNCPDYSETSGLRVYVNREMSKFLWTPVVANTDDTLTTTAAHGLVALDGVIFETDGTIITPITADTVVYYVITAGLTTTKFEVSTSYSATGTAVNISDAQTGSNHKYTKTNKEPGIPVIHHPYLARCASLDFLIEKKLPQKNDIAQLINKDEQNILEYWNNCNRELRTILQVEQRNFK
jgi:hypothetical protein